MQVHKSFTLTHWGRVTHISVSKLAIIGSDNVLSPGRRQAIIWPNAGIFIIEPLGTKFSEILIKIYTFSFKKMHLKMSFGKWRPFCLGLYVLTQCSVTRAYMHASATWVTISLQWHHNGHDSLSNHQPRDCLLKRLFRRRSKKTSKLCVTGLCAGNSPGTGEFPAQMASNAEHVSIWWRHHDIHASAKWVTIYSSNILTPDRHQFITWMNTDLSLSELRETNFSNLNKIETFYFTKCNYRFVNEQYDTIYMMKVDLINSFWQKSNLQTTFRLFPTKPQQ